jgi:hypothetical protein
MTLKLTRKQLANISLEQLQELQKQGVEIIVV